MPEFPAIEPIKLNDWATGQPADDFTVITVRDFDRMSRAELLLHTSRIDALMNGVSLPVPSGHLELFESLLDLGGDSQPVFAPRHEIWRDR